MAPAVCVVMLDAAMTAETWPYDLPIWRRSHRAVAPDGLCVAEIDPAWEVSMGNPTAGTLRLSSGLELPRCNPSFLWSSDGRWLAVPRFFLRLGLFRRQRLLVVDVRDRAVHASPEVTSYFQPESFEGGRLVATRNPHRRGPRVVWHVPDDLVRFRRLRVDWGPTRVVPG